MILQREPQSAQLYGNASAGATINVLLDGKHVATAAASTNGSWVAQMPPQPAGLNHTVTVRAAAHSGVPTSLASVTLVDVGFGDVYLCTGRKCWPPACIVWLALFQAAGSSVSLFHLPSTLTAAFREILTRSMLILLQKAIWSSL
jgi:hypothetical protein